MNIALKIALICGLLLCALMFVLGVCALFLIQVPLIVRVSTGVFAMLTAVGFAALGIALFMDL